MGRLFMGTAEKIPPSELVDTTGAGDAFIGAVVYGTFNHSTSFVSLFCFLMICHSLVKIVTFYIPEGCYKQVGKTT